jgi:hypothetical protein
VGMWCRASARCFASFGIRRLSVANQGRCGRIETGVETTRSTRSCVDHARAANGQMRRGARSGIRTRTTYRFGRFKLDHPVFADVRGCPLAQVSPINVRRRAPAYLGVSRSVMRPQLRPRRLSGRCGENGRGLELLHKDQGAPVGRGPPPELTPPASTPSSYRPTPHWHPRHELVPKFEAIHCAISSAITSAIAPPKLAVELLSHACRYAHGHTYRHAHGQIPARVNGTPKQHRTLHYIYGPWAAHLCSDYESCRTFGHRGRLGRARKERPPVAAGAAPRSKPCMHRLEMTV